RSPVPAPGAPLAFPPPAVVDRRLLPLSRWLALLAQPAMLPPRSPRGLGLRPVPARVASASAPARPVVSVPGAIHSSARSTPVAPDRVERAGQTPLCPGWRAGFGNWGVDSGSAHAPGARVRRQLGLLAGFSPGL